MSMYMGAICACINGLLVGCLHGLLLVFSYRTKLIDLEFKILPEVRVAGW